MTTATDPQRCMTPEFRAAYAYLFEPQKPKADSENQTPYITVTALFKKGENLDVMKKAAHAALVKKFGEEKMKNPDFIKRLRSPFRDQAEAAKFDDKTGKTVLPDGYEAGAFFVRLKNKERVGIVGTEPDTSKPQKGDGTYPPKHITDPALVYGGCYGRAVVRANAYDTKGNVGVSFWLEGFQKTRDGEPLGGRRINAQEAFEPVAAAVADQGAGSIFG